MSKLLYFTIEMQSILPCRNLAMSYLLLLGINNVNYYIVKQYRVVIVISISVISKNIKVKMIVM